MTRRPHLAPVRKPFHAVVRAVVPAAGTMDAGERDRLEAVVDGALGGRPPGVRRQLRLFLRVLGALALVRYGRTLGSLDAVRTRRLLASLERSPFLLLRRGVWGVRTLAFMGWYGRPGARAEVGYGAAAGGWRALGRTAGPWPERKGAAPPEEGVLLAGHPPPGRGEPGAGRGRRGRGRGDGGGAGA